MTTVSHDLEVENSPCRVLCVDDNRDSADLEVLMLQMSGFDSKAVYDGKTALREARSYLPRVCIIDLNMPGMDGDELAVQLKSIPELKSTIMVALTAQSGDEAHQRIEKAGFVLHLVKPHDPTELVKKIDELCRNSHLS